VRRVSDKMPIILRAMAQVYTKTGDDGTTSLLYGGRRRKDDARVEACGAIDEAVAALGAARFEAGPGGLHELLTRLQRELFAVGAELATSPENRSKLRDGTTRVTAGMVRALEPLIDAELESRPLENRFVLPGGTRLGAALDLSRVTVRRAERRAVAALEGEEPGEVLHYLNRLSDLLFVLARGAEGEPDYL
jgi:cob(I)alamin adenosyltransferase